MHLGAIAYLVKPFKPEELIKLAKEVLSPGANVAPQMVSMAPKKP